MTQRAPHRATDVTVHRTAAAPDSESPKVWAEALDEPGFREKLEKALATPDSDYVEYVPRRHRR